MLAPVDNILKLWYMRDNHTFIRLPLDLNVAMTKLRTAFIDERDTYGMLCTKQGPMQNAPEHAYANWDEFEPRARKWIKDALEPSDAEIEYASWSLS